MRRCRRAGLGLMAMLIVSASQAFGLGSSNGKDVVNPAVDFHATLTDRDGAGVKCTRVNVGGEVQLEGDMGRGRLKIAFDNIERVEIEADSRDKSRATVTLRGGGTVNLSVRNSLTVYGHTSMGLYQIRARDLKRIEFAR